MKKNLKEKRIAKLTCRYHMRFPQSQLHSRPRGIPGQTGCSVLYSQTLVCGSQCRFWQPPASQTRARTKPYRY